ncbi:MAG TPA: HAMP domain-containing sensor histidine kinase [Candidatus Limnocylindrales bacterium]|nr:HAMP domain-containing sensor histidine kinase [Candidatus Limnocylindrales bacterium]
MNRLPRRRSIRTRLALIYTGLLAVALIAFGAGLFFVLRAQLEASFDVGLRANAEHASGAFAQDVDASGALSPSQRLVDQFASTGGRVVILDPSGSVLGDSAGSGATPLPVAAEDLIAADRRDHVTRDVRWADDVLRITVEPVIAADGRQMGYVAWAESTRRLRDVLTDVGSSLVLGACVVVLLALAGGLVLARGALAPVAEVTDTARAIALSGDFAARVDAGRPGDEVGDLAVAFNEMLAALEHNHQTLQRFLGDASHQLRTPLTTIRANLDLARRQDVPDEDRRAILADARDEAERMARLVTDLLALARADSGARLDVAPVELDAVVVEAVRRQAQAASHVKMTVSVAPALVDGDRDRLADLLGVLLDNAARYTPDGGSVDTELSINDGLAVLRVSDTGIGLTDEDRRRVFERLYRGTRARGLRPSGTGLGLAIARWIVESHGGTIELTNRDGGGARATIMLPLHEP